MIAGCYPVRGLRAWATFLACLMSGPVLLSGCQARAQSPPASPVAAPAATSATPAESPRSAVAGKRICLDPGHGGTESGAVGPQGTKEKDINLKVGLALRDLLEKAGATVVMTRTGDETVGILERGKFNRAQKTDLFISIHHNANAQNDPASDRVEVFWHWHDDGGPSEDAARAVLRPLQATFHQPNSKAYLCWAYGVLRENSYPAILGEAFYLSSPEEEQRLLSDPTYLNEEAEAYFRGIEAFFAGGRPDVMLIPGSRPAETRVVSAAVLQPDHLSLLDPSWTRLELDGRSLRSFFFYRADFGMLFGALPTSDLAGTHTLTLAARNLAGHTSFVRNLPLFFESPWTPPKPSPQARIDRAEILGVPKPGAEPIPLPGAELFGQQVRNVYALAGRDGVVRLDAAERLTPEPHFVRADGHWTAEANLTHVKRVVLQPMFRGTLRDKRIIVDAEGGGDVPVAVGPAGFRASDANLETALYLADYLRQAGAEIAMPRTADSAIDNVARVRFGLKRNPDVFLTVGHRLPEPGMKEKPGQLVSRVGSRWDEGRKIGRHMIFHLRQLLGTGAALGDPTSRDPLPTEVHNWSSWEVMHAAEAYSAVYVCPMMFDGPGVEARLSTTAGTRKEALAIFYGLLDYFGLDDRTLASIEGTVVDAQSGEPLADTLVWLNETLLTQTESDGKFLFKYLDSGKHKVRAMCKGHRMITQTVELGDKEAQSLKLELPQGSILDRSIPALP